MVTNWFFVVDLCVSCVLIWVDDKELLRIFIIIEMNFYPNKIWLTDIVSCVCILWGMIFRLCIEEHTFILPHLHHLHLRFEYKHFNEHENINHSRMKIDVMEKFNVYLVTLCAHSYICMYIYAQYEKIKINYFQLKNVLQQHMCFVVDEMLKCRKKENQNYHNIMHEI